MPLDDDARRRAAETKRLRTSDRIKDAVGNLIHQGVELHELTMRQVAEEAGVSEATLYRHFSNLAALLHDLFAEADVDPDWLGDELDPIGATVQIAKLIRSKTVGVDWERISERLLLMTDFGHADLDEIAHAFLYEMMGQYSPAESDTSS